MRPIDRASLSVLVFVVSSAAQAGSLAPPVGPIAPSMLTLDAIEPRDILKTFFESGAAVNTITQPGQYVAIGDIIVPAGKHGILIDLPPGASGQVSIDLNGFEIRGQPGSLDGVRKAGAFSACNFNIQNGTIVGMGGDGAHIENMQEANLCVSVRQCGGDGMEFMGVPVVSAMAINAKAPPPGAGNIVKGMGGHCVRASGCGEVVIDLTMSDAAQDGLRIENTDRCDLSFDVARCVGNGVSVTGCPEVFGMAINAKALPGGGVGIRHRVAQCGGGVVFTQCGNVQMSGLRVSGSGGGGGGGVPASGIGLIADTCDRLSLEGCTITDGTSHGYQFTDCEGVSMIACGFSKLGGDGIHAVSTAALRASKGRWIEVDIRHPAGSGDLCTGHGIYVSGIDTVSLANGLIRACDGDGVHIEAAAGASDKFVQVRGFRVERCAGDGIEVECDNLDIAECATQNNGGNGIASVHRKNLTINLVKSTDNQGDGLHVRESLVGVRQQGKTTQVTRSNISNNRLAGVSVEIAGTLTMDEVEANGNDMAGCDALLLPALGSVQEKAKQTKCRFAGNGFGTPEAFPGCLIRGAASVELREVDCSGNAASGLVLADLERDGRLDLVTCTSNGLHGVHMTTFTGLPGGRLHAVGLFCDGNTLDGLSVDSTIGGNIADCTFMNNGGVGLRCLATGHVIHRNSLLSNTGGPIIVAIPGNSVGPLVDEGTISTNCNPSANHVR